MIKDIDVVAVVVTPQESLYYFYRDSTLWARIRGGCSSEGFFDYRMPSRNLKQELATRNRKGHTVITDETEIKKYLMLEELLR